MKKYDRRSGIAILLTSLICLAMIPMIGLAIDGTTSYMMRGRISTALDAAVLAGARSLNGSGSLDAQAANAQSVAVMVFNANLQLPNANVQTTFTVPSPGTNNYRIVSGTATADVPLSMMALMGISTAHISLTAQAQRRDVNLILVMDHSYSMNSVLPNVQTDATNFVNMFANGRDNLGLVTFTGSAVVDYSPQNTFLSDSTNIPILIGQLTQETIWASANAAAGLSVAYQQLQNLNKPGALNVIVFFTGGLPYAFTGDFTNQISRPTCFAPVSPLVGTISSDSFGAHAWGISSSVDTATGTVTSADMNYAFEQKPPPSAPSTCSPRQSPGLTINAFPPVDMYNNSTGVASAGYTPVVFPPGDALYNTITEASENAFDDSANKIHGDTSLTPVIYTIGLFDPSLNSVQNNVPPNRTLLAKVANDPGSPYFNSNQPAGQYFEAPTIAQLNGIFTKIASEVLRLAK